MLPSTCTADLTNSAATVIVHLNRSTKRHEISNRTFIACYKWPQVTRIVLSGCFCARWAMIWAASSPLEPSNTKYSTPTDSQGRSMLPKLTTKPTLLSRMKRRSLMQATSPKSSPSRILKTPKHSDYGPKSLNL